jgi:hypothetical protein
LSSPLRQPTVGLLAVGWFVDKVGTKIGYAVSVIWWSIAGMLLVRYLQSSWEPGRWLQPPLYHLWLYVLAGGWHYSFTNPKPKAVHLNQLI